MKKGMKYLSLIFILALLVAIVKIFTPQESTVATESSARFDKRYKEIMDSNLDRPIDKQQLKETTAEDAFKYFSGNRSIGNEEAQSYLVECAHQNTPYSPVLYFLSKAKLHPEKSF